MLNRTSADEHGGSGSGLVRLPLRSPRARAAFLAAGLLATGLYLGLVLRTYAASRLNASLDAPALQRAIALEPGNAAHPWALGRVQYFARQDFPAAVRYFRRATELQPHVARYWLDLAAAYQVVGDTAGQRRALARALRADPTTPDLVREAANYYLVLGDRQRALQLFGTVVRHDPAAAGPALDLCWRATRDLDAITAHVLPRSADAYLTFLNTLLSQKQTQAALQLWPRLVALQQEIRPQAAFRYIDYLIEQREGGPASQAWNDIARMTPSFAPHLAGGNRLVNGDFEQDILNGGFDWRYHSSAQVALALDTTTRHNGLRSLCITFQGEPVADAGIFQYVPVQPNSRYLLTVGVRTEDLVGAGAPRFGVRDAYSNAWYVQSDEIEPSSAWRVQRVEFTTGPDARLVVLSLLRNPGNTRIRGRMWIDDLRLEKP